MDFERVQSPDSDRFVLRQSHLAGYRWLGAALAMFVAYDVLWRMGDADAPLLTPLLCDAFLTLVAVGFLTFQRSASVDRAGIVRSTWEVPGFRSSSRTRLDPSAVVVERAFVHTAESMYGVRHDILYVSGADGRKARLAHFRDEGIARRYAEEVADFLDVPLDDQTLRKDRIPSVAFGLRGEARW